ncbi:MAG: tyrosine-type recombinase/integrase [Bacteroidota bacterium]
MIAEVKFYLEKRKDKETGRLIDNNVPIFLFFSFNGQRLQYFTGFRIDMYKWDNEHHKIKKNYEEAAEINKELGKLKAKVENIYERAKALEIEPTVKYFREQLKKTNGTISSQKSFADCYNEFIEISKLTKGAGTVKSIKSSLNILQVFSKIAGVKLDFTNIDQDFYNSLLEYSFNVAKYRNNYTGKIIKDLKAFLNWATEQGYNTKLDFKKKSFKKLREEPEIIFLTYDELMKLYKLKLKEKRLADIRDVFCFGCFTGMRYSDIAALSPENIHKEQIIYRIVKTGETNTIPLNIYTKEILKRHKGHPEKCLPVISEQKTNLYLKELAKKKAKLKRPVQIVHFQGAKRINETIPLHEAITFHVSKKTFMTNFLAKGGSLLTAMSITGNKDLRTARRYYKVVDALKADEMKKVFG